ncbi:NAD-dependent epimerase/dehydratase family protein [Rhabdaerophilum sp. SD176]|uniref:NAD-dependent epimerase/dehydratase family protein n=1 Tax=Rhabdaerophilum sp. SD176 TaxID=2983548 RepID=UPI0024DF5EDC|nr:NAD-dependent epimerase/dehydratase family protein [Rhabdaerophilum sp. SD176]
MKVLVVGANGFVGRHVVDALKASGLAEPFRGVRKARPGAAPVRLLDATDPASAQAASAGMQAVVNCVLGSPDTMIRSTEALIAAAFHHGVRRFVHLSSIAVYGSLEGMIDEDSPQGEGVNAYGEAKIRCEALVRAAQDRGLETIILRPGLVCGPESHPWTLRIGRLLRQRRLGDLGAEGDGFANLIAVEDVAAAIARALFCEASGRSYNLAMPDPPRWNRYLLDLAKGLGATPVHRVPAYQLRLESRLAVLPLKFMEKLAGAKPWLPEAITPSLARLFSSDVRFSAAATDADLGFERTGYETIMAQSIDWLRSVR